MVEVGVVDATLRGRRWKGESMENSSWITSLIGGVKGTHLSQSYSEISIEYVCS
jgi:hypothetical protein